MRIGVVEAILEDLAEEGAEQAPGELLARHRDRVAASVTGRPSTSSITSTRGVESVGCTVGTLTPVSAPRLVRSRVPADASCS
jgi:hypothetical protein